MENKKGKVYTITSMKGGVGKTTAVLMLAEIFSKCGKRVIIIDLDLYNGNLAFAYNANIKNTIYNLCDDMANNRLLNGINEDYACPISQNIHLIPAPKDPRQANKINNKFLDSIINSLSYMYDVILIDTNHILNVCNMIAFENSDKIIDIVTNDSFDLQSTKNFVAICKNVAVDNLILILNNTIDNRKNYYTLHDIKNITKKEVDYTIPSNLYLKNFDKLVINGELTNFHDNFKGDAKKGFEDLASYMINLYEEGDVANEKV